jgi:hypothetical protein
VLYQLQILAAQDHKTYGRYLKRNSLNWLELVQAALKPSQRSTTLATLIVAVFDGLLMEVMSTGDRRRASAAIFSSWQESTPTPGAPFENLLCTRSGAMKLSVPIHLFAPCLLAPLLAWFFRFFRRRARRVQNLQVHRIIPP